MYRIWKTLAEYSGLLILGALTGLIWANIAPSSYHHFIELPLFGGDAAGHGGVTVHFLINDVLMALFFAVAGKEVWEAVALPDGALRGRRAVTPLIATVGGMAGPAAVFLLGAALLGDLSTLARGWAIPTATDIAFSYLVGRIVFGAGHPAVAFLLLLAIADDAGGLVILAVFYPQGAVTPSWLLLSLAAAVGVYLLANRLPRMRAANGGGLAALARRLDFWPYALAACISWYAFLRAGIHPALGLLPIIPAIPHAATELGVFAEEEEHLPDLLNRMEHALKPIIEIVLFLFGLANAGVELSSVGAVTWLVLASLVIGKPVGIALFGWLAAGPLRFGLPEGMRTSDLVVIGFVAAIGFTVALFVAGVAFGPGPTQDAAKMGALLSLGAAVFAIAAGRLLGVVRQP